MTDSLPSPDSSEPSSSALVAVGRILGAHGRDGGVRLRSTSDVPGRFDVGESLSVSHDGVNLEGRSFQIAESRAVAHKGHNELFLWFRGFRDRDQAQMLAGLWLCVPQSEVPSAEEGEYFHYQLLGLNVRTVEGEELGQLAEILETGSNDVYVVKGAEGEILVPALGKVVREIDIASSLMVVDLPEGLR